MKQTSDNDRRVVRTKQNIYEAFISLLMEKDISMITVKELSERADINRKTFYTYYSNIDDLFQQLLNHFANKFLNALDHFDITSPTLNALELFTNLNKVIHADFPLYQRLHELNSLTPFINHIKAAILAKYQACYQEDFNISKAEYNLYLEYFLSGILAMYMKWFSVEPEISIDQLTKMAGIASFNGFKFIRDQMGL